MNPKQFVFSLFNVVKKEGGDNHLEFDCLKKIARQVHKNLHQSSIPFKPLDPDRATDLQAGRRLRHSMAFLKGKAHFAKLQTVISRSAPAPDETRFGGPRNTYQSFYAPNTNDLFNNAPETVYHEPQSVLHQALGALPFGPYVRDRPFVNGPPRDVHTSFSWSPDSASFQSMIPPVKEEPEGPVSQDELMVDNKTEESASETAPADNASFNESFAAFEEHDSGIALDDAPETKIHVALNTDGVAMSKDNAVNVHHEDVNYENTVSSENNAVNFNNNARNSENNAFDHENNTANYEGNGVNCNNEDIVYENNAADFNNKAVNSENKARNVKNNAVNLNKVVNFETKARISKNKPRITKDKAVSFMKAVNIMSKDVNFVNNAPNTNNKHVNYENTTVDLEDTVNFENRARISEDEDVNFKNTVDCGNKDASYENNTADFENSGVNYENNDVNIQAVDYENIARNSMNKDVNSENNAANINEAGNSRIKAVNYENNAVNYETNVPNFKNNAVNVKHASNTPPDAHCIPTIIVTDTEDSTQSTPSTPSTPSTQSSRFNNSTQDTQYSDESNPATQPEFANRLMVDPKKLLSVPRKTRAPASQTSLLRRSPRITRAYAMVDLVHTQMFGPSEPMSRRARKVSLGKRGRDDEAGGLTKKMKRTGGFNETAM
ncbi:hypothetical protein ACJBU6_09158 [Exserohilum turcicum]